MDKNKNKVLRDACRKCNYCCVYAPDDPSKTLKACAGCEVIYYCSRECQVNDWKSHKSFCREKAQNKAAISNTLGASFTEYTDYWRNQHMVLLSLVAKLTLGNLRETHVLIIVSNYDPNVGRDKRACIQIESVSTESFVSLIAKYGDAMRTAFTDIMKNSKSDPSNDYHAVLNFISNRGDPAAPGPMCKMSCFGYPRHVPPFMTVDQAIAKINKGDYNKSDYNL